uniref:Uncharacterized protein n=1 Tax=Eutreptiella gymnastica TaxID=73025 RepID=A0A7S1NNT2_9EUGL
MGLFKGYNGCMLVGIIFCASGSSTNNHSGDLQDVHAYVTNHAKRKLIPIETDSSCCGLLHHKWQGHHKCQLSAPHYLYVIFLFSPTQFIFQSHSEIIATFRFPTVLQPNKYKKQNANQPCPKSRGLRKTNQLGGGLGFKCLHTI